LGHQSTKNIIRDELLSHFFVFLPAGMKVGVFVATIVFKLVLVIGFYIRKFVNCPAVAFVVWSEALTLTLNYLRTQNLLTPTNEKHYSALPAFLPAETGFLKSAC
jgi:hypothetical protein